MNLLKEIFCQKNKKHATNEKTNVVISDTLINEAVDQLLKSNFNNQYIPDSIERKIYHTIIKDVLMCAANQKIELFGHEITVHVRPKKEDSSTCQ